jgi:hypothetical protein
VQGTVTLSSAAPAGGAPVSLSSSNAAAQVPGSVSVGQGSTTANFTVTTSSVSSATNVTITGSSGGATRQVSLTLQPGLAAKFTVTGPTGNGNTCKINNGGANFDCTFDGSSSTGSPTQFNWAYSLPHQPNLTGTGVTFVPSTGQCGLFNSLSDAQKQDKTTVVQMDVQLTVKDSQNNSATSGTTSVTVVPNKQCGFGF